MKISDLAVNDRLFNYRTNSIYVITEIGCYHGDEIAFDELTEATTRHRMMTFKQFERLKYIRRAYPTRLEINAKQCGLYPTIDKYGYRLPR